MKSISVRLGTAGNQWRARRARDWNVLFDPPTVLAASLVFIGYYLGARIGFALTFQPHPVSVLWPPNSILVAALLLTPPRIWWFLLLAAFPAHWAAQWQNHVPPLMILCWFISNSCEALIGAGLARYLVGGPIRFTSLRNVGIFCLCVVFAGPFLSSFLDAAFVIWNRWGEGSYWELIRIRFFSNVLAALIVVPLIVSWTTNGIAGLRTARRLPYLEACVLFLGLLSVSYAVLYELGSGADAALLFLPLPFLLWAAVRFGSLGTSSAIFIVGFLAIWSGSHGHGPFSGGTAEQNALSIQIFLVALTIPILFLAAVIEERAAGQIDLREFEERVVLAAEAAHLGVWELDTVTNEVWMSDKARALFQFDLETPIDYSLLQDRVHPEDRARRDSALKRAIETHGEYEIEYRVLLPDGTFRWIAGRGRCVTGRNGTGMRLIAVSMDVTPQKEAQDLFRLAAEGSHLGVWHWEEVAKTLSWDGAARKIFDVSVDEEITLDTFYRCLHPDDAERVKQTWRRAVESGLPYQIEFRTRRTDGSIRWLHGRGRGYYDKAGKPLWMTGVVFDITAQKEAELEAKQRRDELSHLSRLALMGEMSASIAHELNQPLAGIASNAGAGQRFIDRGNVDLQEIRDLLADIGADARRASNVVRGIRGMIKKEQTARHRINLNDVVTNVAQMVRADALLHASELKTSLEANLPIVEADPVQIQQVLINLVVNAFDAMRETPAAKRKVEITTQQNADGGVRVSVRDYGIGISEETRSRLFEQFFTTKPDGLGMGLPIVRSIVEAHAGTMEAENAEGGGARFDFTLPTSTPR